jgi:hypothetical protein
MRIRETNEQSETLQRIKESLMKECEKLKNQSRKSDRQNLNTRLITGNKTPNRYGPSTSTGNDYLKSSVFVGGLSKVFGQRPLLGENNRSSSASS